MNILIEIEDQNEGIAPSSLSVVPEKSKQKSTADCCGTTTGSHNETKSLQSKVPAVTRRVRFLEEVMVPFNNNDLNINRSDGLLQSNASRGTVFKNCMDFDDDASLDSLDDGDNGIANEIEDSMSLSAIFFSAAEAADVEEERRQHIRWACAPRTNKSAKGESMSYQHQPVNEDHAYHDA